MIYFYIKGNIKLYDKSMFVVNFEIKAISVICKKENIDLNQPEVMG